MKIGLKTAFRFLLYAALFEFGFFGGLPLEASETLAFNRDIRPLLGEYCLACHGPDPAARKAGLRLDTEQGLFSTSDSGIAVVQAGSLERSELWLRMTTRDPDDVMPPEKHGKVLSKEAKSLFRRWILEGAPWEDHWAFIPPTKPTVPALPESFQVHYRNPIDGFVLDKLRRLNLKPAAEADRFVLARRLALDLTGVPPSPEEVRQFVADAAPDYFERYVDRLMDSERWGEHRGRYWLDAARYADTHGLHFDNYREIWPYRDWVIKAFNRNMPFDQFSVEQLAGDLLPDPSLEQLVATGFQRCNMTTNEGGTIEEENLTFYANDRVTTTSWVWLGLTANCAACHDHKFDPISQKDFYSMAAFYRNTKQSGFDRNRREGDDSFLVPLTDEDRDRWESLPLELKRARQQIEDESKRLKDRFIGWLSEESSIEEVNACDPSVPLPGSTLQEAIGWWERGAEEAGVDISEAGKIVDSRFQLKAAMPISIVGWLKLPEEGDGAVSLLSRKEGDTERKRGWDFFVEDERLHLHLSHWEPKITLKASTEKLIKPGRWYHIGVVYDGAERSNQVRFFVDGAKVKNRGGNNRLEGSLENGGFLKLGGRPSGEALKGVRVGDVRLFERILREEEIRAVASGRSFATLFSDRATILADYDWALEKQRVLNETKASTEQEELPEKEANERKEERKKLEAQVAAKKVRYRNLFDSYRIRFDRGYRRAVAKLTNLETEEIRLRARNPVTHVQVEKMDSSPMAKILNRGQYDQPGEAVEAAVFQALHPFPEGAPRNRLGLAEWLMADNNPLTARVTVNRFWQELFGEGLVRTAEDFGAVGEAPSNQALLDWLAVEFRDSGWNVKRLFRLMVSSATYRQSAKTTQEKEMKDPGNRYLSRGPRFRMDAEMVRDYAMSVSGLLSSRVGGPSVKPLQPGGVWEAVAMPESNTRFYEAGEDEALFRRSMYTFWKRAAPPALMDILNAPSREVCSVRRERTNTPIQALATLNNPEFIACATWAASRALEAASGERDQALGHLGWQILCRPLKPEETKVLSDLADEATSYYEANLEEAERLVGTGASGVLENVAALTLIANQLLNLDETLTK